MDETALSALSLPTAGRVIDLAPLREPGMPDRHGRAWHQVLRTGDALPALPPLGANDVTGFEEVVTASTHLGCHVDAPGSRLVAGRAADGTPYREYYGNDGLRALGAERVRPVLARGVLLGTAEVRAGDAVLIRTDGAPPDPALLADIVSRGAAVIGLDTEGCELDLPVPVISHLVLAELAAAASGPFLFLMAPIRGAGSTAAPASPVAVL